MVNLKIGNHHRLLIRDVKDLYVNVLIQETLNLTRAQLILNNDKPTTHQIMALLDIILRQNYFCFNDQVY
jgi:hypothetical protein